MNKNEGLYCFSYYTVCSIKINMLLIWDSPQYHIYLMLPFFFKFILHRDRDCKYYLTYFRCCYYNVHLVITQSFAGKKIIKNVLHLQVLGKVSKQEHCHSLATAMVVLLSLQNTPSRSSLRRSRRVPPAPPESQRTSECCGSRRENTSHDGSSKWSRRCCR